jgi:hypothetical protein
MFGKCQPTFVTTVQRVRRCSGIRMDMKSLMKSRTLLSQLLMRLSTNSLVPRLHHITSSSSSLGVSSLQRHLLAAGHVNFCATSTIYPFLVPRRVVSAICQTYFQDAGKYGPVTLRLYKEANRMSCNCHSIPLTICNYRITLRQMATPRFRSCPPFWKPILTMRF